MRSLHHANRVVLALGANAILLMLILIALITRDGRGLSSTAFGQPVSFSGMNSPAGSITAMPCQLSQNTWGCYVMDPQNQTLCVYQYLPHEELRFLAARDIQYDRKLGHYNTSPAPSEIRARVESAEEPLRAAPTTNRSPEQDH